MQGYLQELITEGEQISERVKKQFGSLSEQQLNWKPAENKWSAGQCLEHLINTNKHYFPLYDKIANGTYKEGFWQKLSPFSKMFGRMFIKIVGPDNKRKFKAPSKAKPDKSNLSSAIIDDFITHQSKIINYLKAFNSIESDKLIVSSPFASVITYPLKDTAYIIIRHEQRHLNQAERVTQMEEFPKA